MSPRRIRRSEYLVLDPDVLRPGPVCEFQSSLAVAAQGGVCVQPWRDLFLANEAAGLTVFPNARAVASASMTQAVVHLQKSRAATFDDLAEAWRILEPGGALLLAGPNTLGVVSAVKRLGEQLGQPGVVVANRARARVVRFRREGTSAPLVEATEPIRIELAGLEPFLLDSLPGVFSAKRLDPGSELLIEAFTRIAGEKPPRRLVDLGCGTGVLGIVAALRASEAEVLMVDADARAVACAERNVARLGLGERCRVLWWDAREKPPESGFDFALVNPPFHHRGPEVDLAPALALFTSLAGWLKRSGRALLVANRTLPYEAPLAHQGELTQIADVRGYKLLLLERRSLGRRSPNSSARSSGASGRKAPGARSGGSSRSPIRSR